MANKRRRKELRQPDEFVTVTMKLGQWIREHQRLVILSATAIIVVVVGVALTIQLVGSSRVNASSSLLSAIGVSAAPVANPDDEEEEIPEEIQHFSTFDERAQAASKAYQKVLAESADSSAERAATLGLASSKLSLGEVSEAKQLYEDFLANPGEFEHMKVYAAEGLGFCYEAQKNYDRALDQFKTIDSEGYQDLSKYHQARMLEHLSKRNSAAVLYRGIVQRAEQATDDMVTDLWVRDRAEARLAVLDPSADVLKQRSKGRGADLLKQILGKRGGGAPGAPRRPAPREPSPK